MAKKLKNKGGRTPRYTKVAAEKAAKLASEGKTINQIAKALNIDRATIYRWKAKYQEFCDALKGGQEESLDKIEESVYRRAKGFTYTEVKQIVEVDAEGKPRVKRIEKITKYIAPDTGAAAFILKTRRPGKWKQTDQSVDASRTYNLEALAIRDEFPDDENEISDDETPAIAENKK